MADRLPPTPVKESVLDEKDTAHLSPAWKKWYSLALSFLNINPPSVAAVGNEDVTLYPGRSPVTNICAVAITTNRTWTLSTEQVQNGSKFRCVRAVASTGAFTISVGGLASLSAGQWCDVEYNGTAWVLTDYGSLSSPSTDAHTVDGYHAGNETGKVPVSNGTVNTDLNADKLDGYHAGNATGNVPVSNGTMNTNLNSEMVGGLKAANIGAFTRVTGADFTTASTSAVDITGLSQALEASSVYEVEIQLVVKSSTDAGIKVGFTCNAAITSLEAIQESANITAGAYNAPARVTSIPALSGAFLTVVNNIGFARYKGIIVTNGACTLTAQMLKVTSGTATCFIDSVMKVTKRSL